MTTPEQLMKAFFEACKDNDVPVSWFNAGFHGDSVELYTAQEHDDWLYFGDLGAECTDEDSVKGFVRSVKEQYKYFIGKEEKV